MTPKRPLRLDCRRVELDGVRYVILRESAFDYLCEAGGVEIVEPDVGESNPAAEFEWDRGSLGEKLVRRRQTVGLAQGELARRAGIRPETLNRIERGRTNPDFTTVRKLVVAMNAAEREKLQQQIEMSSGSEEEFTDERAK
jgi:DNA-binding XRE family transcriptional regulator